MHENLKQIQGSYKLSAKVIKRLTRRTLTDIHGNNCPGASKLMILSMIYFSHICSPSGFIPEFKISDLSLVLRCSRRSTFNLLTLLRDRGFIEFEGTPFRGIYNINILDNDFSSITDYSGVRYLNTNREFFNSRSNNSYEIFIDISLYSMRLFLLLLLNYNQKNGYHVSFDTLCSQITVKKRALIHNYLEEIRHVIGSDFCSVVPNRIKHLKFGSIFISKNTSSLSPEYGLSYSQDSYYNHKWKAKLLSLGIVIDYSLGTAHYHAGRIYAIVSDFLRLNLSLLLIENTITDILTDHGIINNFTYSDIYNKLLALT